MGEGEGAVSGCSGFGLGHEQMETTQVYLHADLALKEKALARTTPVNTSPGRYRPSDRAPCVS